MVITATLLPAVLAATCLALLALGMSFNMMTLGGMAAAVGLVVDDAVVMLEHLMRRLQEAHGPDRTGTAERPSMLAAAREMGRPLIGSTCATIVVFLPLAFISGVTGGFFKALAVTMVAALGVSLVYARYALPLVADGWLTVKDAEAAERAERFTGGMTRGYAAGTTRLLRRPGLFVAVIALVLAGVGVFSWLHVQSGFMPKMDEGGFILDYKAKPGAALSDTDRLLRQVEAIVRATPEVASYSRRTGVQLGGGLTEPDEGDFFIRLKSGSRRDIEEVMSEIAAKIAAQVPGLQVETAQLMEDLIGDLTAVPQPIEVKLFGDDAEQLAKAAQTVATGIGDIPGVVEVNNGLRVAGDAVTIEVDRGAAALAGLDPDAVTKQVTAEVEGSIATQVRSGEEVIDVRVRLPRDLRQRTDALAALPLRATDGRTVALGRIAKISIAAGQRQITREDLAPFIPITARLENRDLGSAVKAVQAKVAGLHLPASIRVEYGGLYAQQQQSFTDLAGVFAAALLLSALLLTFLFERWAFTVAVIATVLLSACAVLGGLWLTGIELDISALMGLTMVIGMLTELAIFFLAEIDARCADHRVDASRGGRGAPAPDRHVGADRDPDPHAARARTRARVGAAKAAGDGDHLRPWRRRGADRRSPAGDTAVAYPSAGIDAGTGRSGAALVRRQAEPGGGTDAAVAEMDRALGQPIGLGGVVGDVDDRNGDAAEEVGKGRQQLPAGRDVEVGERLVHQQQARLAEQRAGDRRPLRFAARQPRRAAVEQRGDAGARDRRHRAGMARRGARGGISEIIGDAQVRQQADRLARRSRPGGDAPARTRRLSCQIAPSMVTVPAKTVEPGDCAQNGRLARARRPEQRGDAGRRDVESDVERESIAYPPAQRNGDRHGRGTPMRRSISSSASRAAKAKATSAAAIRCAAPNCRLSTRL